MILSPSDDLSLLYHQHQFYSNTNSRLHIDISLNKKVSNTNLIEHTSSLQRLMRRKVKNAMKKLEHKSGTNLCE